MFTLHPQLEKDTLLIGDMPLSRVVLMNDSQYPWVIQVPRQENIREMFELEPAQQQQAFAESLHISQALQRLFNPDKLNMAALGNMVPQLHIHHIARFTSDPAWPKPVWGAMPAVAYSDEAAQSRLALLREALSV